MANTKLITRTIAAALLGATVLGAPIASHAQDFRARSNGVNVVTTRTANFNTVRNNTVLAASLTRSLNHTGFSNRNSGIHKVAYAKNKLIEQRLYKIEREIYTTDLKIEKLEYELVRLNKISKFSRNRISTKLKRKDIRTKISYLEKSKYSLQLEAKKLKIKAY